MSTKSIIIVCLVVAGASFYTGTFFGGNNHMSAREGNFAAFSSGENSARFTESGTASVRTFGGGRGMGGVTMGEIIAIDTQTLTVKLSGGGSRIVFYSAEIPMTKSIEVPPEELVVGEQVMVIGQTNSDGSINASSIQMGIEERLLDGPRQVQF